MAVTYESSEPIAFAEERFSPAASLVLSNARLWMAGVLVASDVLSLLMSGLLALWLRGLFGPFDAFPYTRFAPLALVFVTVFAWRGLYPAIGLGAVEELRRLTINTCLTFTAIIAFAYVVHVPPVYSRPAFVIAWLLALGLIPLNRALIRAVLSRLKLWGEPVAVVEQSGSAAEIGAILQRYPKIGLRPIPVCRGGTCPAVAGRSALEEPNRGMSDACRECPVRLARVVLVVYSDYNEIDSVREKYQDTFERVILVNQRDRGLALSSTSVQEFGGLAGLEVRQNLLNKWSQAEKRLIDLVASVLGIIFLAPFLSVLALCIYLDSPGPVFYRQRRLGKRGKVIGLLKFRSMHTNADLVLRDYLDRDPALREEWDRYQKLRVDPRITRVGSFIRRFSLDELPQLWNVLIGEMSLVGPRPMMIDQKSLYGKPYEHYIRVTPGITGLWQVSGRNKTTFARRAELDVQYVMNWSVWLDLYILARTLWVVITRDGAA